MGLFSNQFSNVVEWEEFRDDMLFWKWDNKEIKKGSKLVVRMGQDAIFMYNGKIEGIFKDEGSFDMESEIIPFLSTLKGFRFGFNSGIRAEVLFVNTKELTVKWGTKNAINIPAPGLPGGMPIKSFGTFCCKISDYEVLIDKIAGVKKQFTIEDVKSRIMSMLDQVIMKWIVKEGKDIFNLQANAFEISNGIQEDLDMEMEKIGIAITNFAISSVSYPKEVQEMATKAASHSMIGDMNKYTQVSMSDSLSKGGSGGSMASDMAGIQVGMMMGQEMINNMNNKPQNNETQEGTSSGKKPNFCPNCGTKNEGANFCPNCGTKLI
ncbi:MAG: SPFH domain-containing protein [Terrisporobacter othiniensis]|uniref:SPFH domain-containing protein n=1 Tax=Terrisporobacter othiniensis TaxID=1577792 RepID=UPI0029113622|nr:SPFH domain-containing protein [Terrisporobacter othiniensis]MDU6984612.1 SPFH domain-containing protein [Terrisporobacter othiniensis]